MATNLHSQLNIPLLTVDEIHDRLYTCEIEIIDDLEGTHYETTPSTLFQFTPDRFVQLYKGSSFLEASTYLSGKSGYRYLNVTIWMDSPEASQIYGSIPIDGLVRLRGLDGYSIQLLNLADGTPNVLDENGKTKYTIKCLLDRQSWKWIKKNDINFLRIYWEKGYEDIPIYHYSLLKRQADCLDKHF